MKAKLLMPLRGCKAGCEMLRTTSGAWLAWPFSDVSAIIAENDTELRSLAAHGVVKIDEECKHEHLLKHIGASGYVEYLCKDCAFIFPSFCFHDNVRSDVDENGSRTTRCLKCGIPLSWPDLKPVVPIMTASDVCKHECTIASGAHVTCRDCRMAFPRDQNPCRHLHRRSTMEEDGNIKVWCESCHADLPPIPVIKREDQKACMMWGTPSCPAWKLHRMVCPSCLEMDTPL